MSINKSGPRGYQTNDRPPTPARAGGDGAGDPAGANRGVMSLRIYNTLSRQKELFEPVHPGKVGMYLCGPTVYKSPHIGHLVGPVIFDAIRRYLAYKGYEVTWVVNITDVDDKLIHAAREQGTTVPALAEKHTAEYNQALARLGIEAGTDFQQPKVSQYIPEIIALIQRLIDRGYAYPADGATAGGAGTGAAASPAGGAGRGDVYFDVVKDADYGKLSNRTLAEAEAGTRETEAAGKRNPADFALWKAAKPGEPAWDSPWGAGRPGWHIECSAMSLKLLGETFDIHGGGDDLKFPHHENELAQSESATGRPFAKYWLHNGLTRINTKGRGPEKISGSELKNQEALRQALDAGNLLDKHGPELLRYLLLSTHYRSPIDFGEEVIAASKKGLSTFTRLFERVERLGGAPLPEKGPDMDQASRELLEGAGEARQASPPADLARAVLSLKMKFLEMMDDDFNTAGAIAALHEMAGEVNAFIEKSGAEREPDKTRAAPAPAAATAAAQTLKNLGQVLGLFRVKPGTEQPLGVASAATPAGPSPLAGQLMDLLIRLRAEARKAKNFPLADGIRKGLSDLGITLEDRADGTLWRKE